MPPRLDRFAKHLSTRDPAALDLGAAATLAYLVAGCALIFAWHASFERERAALDPTFAATPGGVGLPTELIKPYFYFFHHTGHFPISFLGDPKRLTDREQVARSFLEPSMIPKPLLVNEVKMMVRKGDFGQLFLLYPDYWRHGRAAHATAATFNRGLALAATLALFVSLSLNHRKLLAIPLIAVMGSNPFQLYHIHLETNVWSYPIQVAGLMLALCAPLLFAPRARAWHWAIPALAGVLLASFREVRTEPALLIVSVALACLFAPGGARRRSGYVAVLLATAFVTGQAWGAYWNEKVPAAISVVKAAGGTPLQDNWNLHHSIWHPIWFGLGDFGQDKGYAHTDAAAYRYAMPILNEKYGRNYRFGGWVYKDANDPRVITKPESLPEYQEVLRDKVIGDVLESPGWYLGILLERARVIFRSTTPVRVAWGASFVQVPFSAWIALPLLALLALAGRWPEVVLLLFYTPTNLPAFLMIARLGYLNPTSFHLMTFALVTTFALIAALRHLPHRRMRTASA